MKAITIRDIYGNLADMQVVSSDTGTIMAELLAHKLYKNSKLGSASCYWELCNVLNNKLTPLHKGSCANFTKK